MEVYKFYEIQKHMTLTRHVYSPHIDVASLAWWKGLDEKTRDRIQGAIHEAAVFQRRENRSKNAQRLALLKEKGMAVVGKTRISTRSGPRWRTLKNLDLFREPRGPGPAGADAGGDEVRSFPQGGNAQYPMLNVQFSRKVFGLLSLFNIGRLSGARCLKTL